MENKDSLYAVFDERNRAAEMAALSGAMSNSSP